MLKLISEEFWAWADTFVQLIPGRLGSLIRRIYFKPRFLKAGWSLSIARNVEIACPANISLGNKVSLVSGVVIRSCNNASLTIGNSFSANGNVRIIADCGGDITIGDNVMIGPNTVIRSANHAYDRLDTPMSKQGHKPGRIVIGEDVWIAANVVVLPDVEIGSHAIVAAGSVVTRSVRKYSIVAGVPAREIGTRNEIYIPRNI